MELRTAGEQLVGHPLMAERKSGVPHYLPGQHHAVIEHEGDEVVGVLSYVDQMGHAVAVVCGYEDGEWTALMRARCGHVHGSLQPWVGANVRLSQKMIDTLEKAREEAGLA